MRAHEFTDQDAAGIVLYAEDTGRYGLQQRADNINDGGLWAAWGGGREPGETLEQCARRELGEESGYWGPIQLERIGENARYVTFLGRVPDEFEPRPDPEWQDFCWVKAGDWPTPMHPGTTAALKNIPVEKQDVAEAFDQPYPLTWTKEKGNNFSRITATTKLDSGDKLEIVFDENVNGDCHVRFWRGQSMDVTGEGGAQRVFATVLNAIKLYLKKVSRPNRIWFSAEKRSPTGEIAPSRAKLYTRMVDRFAPEFGYQTKVKDDRAFTSFVLTKNDSKPGVAEEQLNELGNSPAEYKPNRRRKRSLFHATVDNNWVDVFFDRSEFNGTLHITFTVNGDYDAPSRPTEASKSTVRILSTVLNIIKQQLPEYIKQDRPPGISFTSKQDNRTSLYRRYFVPVIQNILGSKWAHEEYPSMGMTVFHWRPVKKQDVTEAFDQPYAVQWTKQNGDWHATADLDDGSELVVLFMAQGDNQWMVEFERDENMEITGEGDAPRVFATVLTAMRQFIAKRKPAMLNFSAEKEDDPTGSRARLYDRMIQRYVTGTGYDLTREDMPGGATYTLTKQVQGVAEDTPLPGDFKLMGQNLFLKNLARNLKQRYPDATVKLSSDRVTAYHNKGDDESLSVMGTEVMDGGYIGVGLDDAFTESFQGVLVPTIKQTTEQLLAANPGTKPALFLSTDNWNPDAWTHIATKLGYRLVADDEQLDENFADGKVKGKSRPGRVKRAGASCAGSVSDLRAKAKRYGGEKGKMYHWCANMKGGRKK